MFNIYVKSLGPGNVFLLHGPKKRFFISSKQIVCVCVYVVEKREKMNPLKSKRAWRHTGEVTAYTYNNIFAVHLFHFFSLPIPARRRTPTRTPTPLTQSYEGCERDAAAGMWPRSIVSCTYVSL